VAKAPGTLWNGVASRTEDRIRGSGSSLRMLFTYFDCRNDQNLKIFIIHNTVLNSLLIYINNNTHYNLYAVLTVALLWLARLWQPCVLIKLKELYCIDRFLFAYVVVFCVMNIRIF